MHVCLSVWGWLQNRWNDYHQTWHRPKTTSKPHYQGVRWSLDQKRRDRTGNGITPLSMRHILGLTKLGLPWNLVDVQYITSRLHRKRSRKWYHEKRCDIIRQKVSVFMPMTALIPMKLGNGLENLQCRVKLASILIGSDFTQQEVTPLNKKWCYYWPKRAKTIQKLGKEPRHYQHRA